MAKEIEDDEDQVLHAMEAAVNICAKRKQLQDQLRIVS